MGLTEDVFTECRYGCDSASISITVLSFFINYTTIVLEILSGMKSDSQWLPHG